MHIQDLTTLLGVYKCCENDDDDDENDDDDVSKKQMEAEEDLGLAMDAQSGYNQFWMFITLCK